MRRSYGGVILYESAGGEPAMSVRMEVMPDAKQRIAMIAMTPLIAIQLLGIVFSRKTGGRS